MDRDTEWALVQRIAAGDTSAFDTIYDEYRARLYSFLVRLSRRRDLAEDLLEQTRLRLVTYAGRIKPGTPLGPWLFVVARNFYLSYCRSRAVEDARAAPLMGVWTQPAPGPSPFEQAAASALEARFERALAALPPQHREVLLLSAVEEMTPAEMAHVCGVTAEVMRQRLFRARSLLAQQMERTAPAHAKLPVREVTR